MELKKWSKLAHGRSRKVETMDVEFHGCISNLGSGRCSGNNRIASRGRRTTPVLKNSHLSEVAPVEPGSPQTSAGHHKHIRKTSQLIVSATVVHASLKYYSLGFILK